jgi:hypothetical protein
MIGLYEYTVVKQAQAFQLPLLEDPSWEDGAQSVCFKFSFCPKIMVCENGKICLNSIGDTTLRAVPGDYLVFQYGELFFVKKKVFELKYKKYEDKGQH